MNHTARSLQLSIVILLQVSRSHTQRGGTQQGLLQWIQLLSFSDYKDPKNQSVDPLYDQRSGLLLSECNTDLVTAIR